MAAAVADVKTEPKDAKPEIKKAKTEAVEENPEPPLLKYKTWVLKVSIHCKGCQNKVQRILRDIDGVYTTDVDLRQQKVTVTGNVEAETLIKKLVQRTGKHAELWPEKADQKQSKSKTKEKEKEKSKQSDEESDEEDTDKEEEIVKVSENGCKQKTVVSKAHEGGGCGCVIGKGGVQIKEPKTEQKQQLSNQSQSVAGEKKVVFISGGESETGNNAEAEKGSSNGGTKKKKKKKKGHKKSVNFEEFDQSANTVPACTESVQCPANHSPPRNPYQYPSYANYYVPPVYAVKYNTAQPSSSYASSYYAAPAPYSSYANYHPDHERPEYEFDRSPPRQSGSFEMFSDENPNACSVM